MHNNCKEGYLGELINVVRTQDVDISFSISAKCFVWQTEINQSIHGATSQQCGVPMEGWRFFAESCFPTTGVEILNLLLRRVIIIFHFFLGFSFLKTPYHTCIHKINHVLHFYRNLIMNILKLSVFLLSDQSHYNHIPH